MTTPEHHAEAILRVALRDLSKVLCDHLGGGSEWFAPIGDEYFVSAKEIEGELRRRKTDAQITKRALVKANIAVREAMGPGWLSIESAPRDELGLILVWNGVEVTGGTPWEGGWVDWLHDWIDPQPVAWMPFPLPPTDANGGR